MSYQNFPLLAGLLYLLTGVISVGSAWIMGLHRFDLGISFSAYVGLQRWTSVLYFIAAVGMIVLLAVYVIRLHIPLIKKLLYAAVFAGIFGTAFFPLNTFSSAPTAVTPHLPNQFAIGLMLATTVSFILSVILSKSKRHKLTAGLSLAFAAGFIMCYAMDIPVLFAAFFIWENLFIVLLLLELSMEQYDDARPERRQ